MFLKPLELRGRDHIIYAEMGMTEMQAPESTVTSSSIHSSGCRMALIPGLRTGNSVLTPPIVDDHWR